MKSCSASDAPFTNFWTHLYYPGSDLIRCDVCLFYVGEENIFRSDTPKLWFLGCRIMVLIRFYLTLINLFILRLCLLAHLLVSLLHFTQDFIVGYQVQLYHLYSFYLIMQSLIYTHWTLLDSRPSYQCA